MHLLNTISKFAWTNILWCLSTKRSFDINATLHSTHVTAINIVENVLKTFHERHQSRVRQLAYVAWVRRPTFIGVNMILDMRPLTRALIFSLWFFIHFSDSCNFILFKNLLLYIWPFIYLFVHGRDRFFTAYNCFKETLYFSIFHTNYLIKNTSP